MSNYNKITALYSRLSVGDEDRDGGESNSIQNQKIFLENYAKGQHLTNIRHYIDDDESGRFFDRSAYSRMIEDVESGKIGVCIMKDLTRWGRDYLQVGNAMEIFRRNNVRFIAVNNGIDSENPDTLEFAPFINIMSEWYAKDISKKVKTGIKTKGMSGKPIATEAPYGYIKAPDNKDFWIIDEEAAEVVRLIFRLFLGGKNRNQIAVYLTQEQIPTPTFYMKDRGRGTCKNKTLNEDNRYKWNKATLTHILTRQEYCGDVVNFKTTKHFRDKRNHYVDRSQWHITENVHDENVYRKMQGHWIIEMSEMIATANAKSIEEIKSFLSRQKETYKIPYETHPADRKRQCVFGGSSNTLDFLPLDRTGNRRFVPVMVYPERAEVHILADEQASREYINQMWAEAMEIYRSGNFRLRFSPAMNAYLKAHQKDFMPEDTKAGQILDYLERYSGSIVCSKQLYKEALGHDYDEPKQWELREINDIMNNAVTGWMAFSNPRYFPEPYRRQKGWERIRNDNEPDNSMDGFQEIPTEEMEQLGLPEEWLKQK